MIGGEWAPALSAHHVLASVLSLFQGLTVILTPTMCRTVHVPILQKGTLRKAYCLGKEHEESSSEIEACAGYPKGPGRK